MTDEAILLKILAACERTAAATDEPGDPERCRYCGMPILLCDCKGVARMGAAMRLDDKEQVTGAHIYTVTRDGEIRNEWSGKILKGEIDDDGYVRVTLRMDDGSGPKKFYVHRLVAEAFVGPEPFSGAVVRHKNHIPDDNRDTNLLWGTVADNIADSVRDGRNCRGDSHGRTKLTKAKITEARSRYASGEPVVSIAKAFGVHFSTVYKRFKQCES